MKSQRELTKEIIDICRWMYEKDYNASTDGNVSVRLDGDRIITTPSGLNKGYISIEQLVIVDMTGKKISGKLMPSSEIKLHLTVYKMRKDVNAVIHAHPPVSIAFSLAGIPLAQCLLPEIAISLGSIPTARYATPTTAQVGEVITDLIKDYDAMILDRHGTLTVGADLITAFNRLQTIEHTAKITFTARQLGEVMPLPKEEIDRLLSIGESFGIRRKYASCQACGGCGRKFPKTTDDNEQEKIPNDIDLAKITNLVREELSKFSFSGISS